MLCTPSSLRANVYQSMSPSPAMLPATLIVFRSLWSRLPTYWAEPKVPLSSVEFSPVSPTRFEFSGNPCTSIAVVANRRSAYRTVEPGFSSCCRSRTRSS